MKRAICIKEKRAGMTAEEQKEMEAYRRKHFKVEVVPANTFTGSEPGEVYLKITHNGHQWNVMNLTPIERLAVIKALLWEV